MANNKRFYAALLLVAMGLLIFSAAVSAQEDTSPAAERLGRWVSVACELRAGPQHLIRDITLTESDWTAVITNFADPACTTPALILTITGPVNYGEPHPLAEGAVESDFVIQTLALEPQNAFIVDFLNSAEPGTCGAEAWEVGVEQDVTETGCVLIGFAELPSTDYDVTFVRDNYLFAGARPLEGGGFESPEDRPTAVQVPLVRVDE
ncbi:MAG: hypothetical protein SF162_08670 [bacterium]|nr:hypothetical protein [bacterium]